jgi:tetratricopeptide (TPR) repeat protein
VLAALAALALSATAQTAGLSPDQIFRQNPRTGKVETIAAVVTENSLSKVRAETPSGDSKQFETTRIVEIVWSSAPASYKDAETNLARGEYERAVAMFRSTASDSDARDVIQAAARFGAARALLARGSSDTSHYDDCASECDRFLSDYPANRDVPKVRWLKARALRLSGKGAEAAQSFKALYEEGASDPPTEGFDRAFCLTAGLDSAEAFLSAGDTLGARELYATLNNALQGLIASTDGDAAPREMAMLESGRGTATLGEGFCLLADGQTDQALSFFEGQRSNVGQASLGGAALGLAEAYLAKGRTRSALIEFARVSAVDHSSADQRARALLGLARASVKLSDTDALEDAKRYIETIQTRYASTPAARDANEFLKTL